MIYDDEMEPGFPGMKCDSGDDRVESFPAAGQIPAGRVVASDPVAEGTVALPVEPFTQMRGVALHSHLAQAYDPFDCVSVMTRDCWRMMDEGVHVIWDNGSERMFPREAFTMTHYGKSWFKKAGVL